MPTSKYQKWTTEEKLTEIRGLARDGLTMDEIAKEIGIRRETLYNWMAKNEELAEVIRRGKAYADRQVEDSLYKRALGYEAEEVKTFVDKGPNGTVVKQEKIKRHIPADTTAIIYWLKNRKPQDWRDKREVELSAQDALNIKIDYGDDDDHGASE